jgi:membrane associated rhomboid family serine protease
VWVFGRPVYHIGASGVVYGLIAFIFWTGIFRRNIKSVILALIMLFMYSPMFAGILPNQPGVSWESHLLGGIAGILVAWLFKNEIEQDEEPVESQLEDSGTEYFFNRDVFEKTLSERRHENGEDWP